MPKSKAKLLDRIAKIIDNGDPQFTTVLEALMDRIESCEKTGYKKSWAARLYYNLTAVDGTLRGFITETPGPQQYSPIKFTASFGGM